MIGRILALLARTDELTAARAELRQIHKALSSEQLTTAQLNSRLEQRKRENRILNVRLDTAIEDLRQTRADAEYVAAERCECGGDAELHWRKRTVAAEKQALQDRVNAIALADEVARLQLIADEAERLHHVIELGRAGIAVVS